MTKLTPDGEKLLNEVIKDNPNLLLHPEFQEVTKPVIKWLNDNMHPHCTIIITQTSAELVEGLLSFPTNEFIKD